MSINVAPSANVPEKAREHLERKLTAYYSSNPESYYAQADCAAQNYTRKQQPFHCDLVSRIKRGDSLLEVGCGSAHLCRFVEAAGGHYAGMDHGEELLQQNRRRFPNARFFSLGTPWPGSFDVVASLYTIEHVVDPPAYLETLWNLCRPGGLIAVISPDFIDGDSLPPSFYYGITPRRFRGKVATLSIRDAALHLLDLFWVAPRWKRRARAQGAGRFWINLAPRIFAGADYSVDADAVHLPRLVDITSWLESRGAKIVETSRTLPGVDGAVLRYNCYALARRPA